MKVLGPDAKRDMGPPIYHVLFIILASSSVAEGLLCPLKLQAR